MLLARISGGSAVAVGLLGIPVLHFAVVDLEGREDAAAYLGHVDDHYLSTALAGGIALLLAATLVVHLASLRLLAARRPLLSDATSAVAAFAAVGVALSGAAAVMAAYGAHEDFPFEAVRLLPRPQQPRQARQLHPGRLHGRRDLKPHPAGPAEVTTAGPELPLPERSTCPPIQHRAISNDGRRGEGITDVAELPQLLGCTAVLKQDRVGLEGISLTGPEPVHSITRATKQHRQLLLVIRPDPLERMLTLGIRHHPRLSNQQTTNSTHAPYLRHVRMAAAHRCLWQSGV